MRVVRDFIRLTATGIMRFFDFFKIVYDEVFAIQLLAVSFSIVWVFYNWERETRNILVGITHMVCIFAVGTVFNWFLFALSSVWRAIAGTHFHVAWLLTVFLYLGIFQRKVYLASRLVTGATLYLSIISMADLGHEVMMCLAVEFVGVYFGWVCFLFSGLIVVFGLVIRKYSIKSFQDLPKLSIVMTMLNTVAATLLIIIKTVMKMQSGMMADGFYCAVLAFIYIISVTGYMMIYHHCMMHRENTILTVQNKLLEADKQTLIVSEQAIEEMRALRHDMRNQHNVMRIMLEEGRYDDLKEYFDSLSAQLEQTTLSEFIDCGNSLIDSVVNMEILKATSYGVKLSSKISVPEVLPFEPSDLCRVLVNLIDNAIEGLLRTEKRDYLIDLKLATRGDYFYACVQNEIRDDADRGGLLSMNTSKDDAVYHGYGHKIVKKIVEKYNGYVNYSIADNVFIAEVMLDMDTSGGAPI